MRWGLALFVSVGLGGTVAAQTNASGWQKVVVRTAAAEALTSAVREQESPQYLALVKANTETDLSFKIGGRIELLGPRPGQDWTEGTQLTSGTVLGRLVQNDLVSAYESALAKARLEVTNEQRNQSLFASKAISRAELDASVAAATAARSDLARASQAVRDSVLLAPFSGVVLSRSASSGETVAAGKPVLRFADLSIASIELGLPDTVVSQVKVGQEIGVSITGLEDQTFRGRIDEVGVAAISGTRLFRVVIKVPNPSGVLRAGMTASVRISPPGDTHKSSGGVLVPLSALVASRKGDRQNVLSVFVVSGEGRAVKRDVTTDEIIGNSIVIREGVKPGEQVVVAGTAMLYDGASVDVQGTPAASAVECGR